MNLNTKINKVTAVAIPAVLAVLFTLLLFILPRTPVLITAYVAGLIGAALFAAGNLYFIGVKKGYPWIAAIPITLIRYIITSTLLSAVFVLVDNVVEDLQISALWLIIAHIAVLAVFFVLLLLLHTGKEYIQEIEQKVASERQFIKELNAELATIRLNAPADTQKDIQNVIDTVRYSDPMSHESLTELEGEIQKNVIMLGRLTGSEQIRAICGTLIVQIKDRNNRTRALK